MIFGPALILGGLGVLALVAATTGDKKKKEELTLYKPPHPGRGLPVVQKDRWRRKPKPPTKTTGIPIPRPGKPQMSVSLKQLMASAILALGVDETGRIKTKPSVSAMQVATATAAQLEAAGFPEAAKTLRQYIKIADAMMPPVPPAKQVPIPLIPPELQERVNRAIQYNRDPKSLRAIAGALRRLPNASDPQVKAVIDMIENLAAQVESDMSKAEDLERVQEVIVSPGLPPTTKPEPVPVPIMNPPTIVDLEPPTAISIPPSPQPQPAPVMLSPVQQAAKTLKLHLLNLQADKGIKGSRDGENTLLVKKFQKRADMKQDGKVGPGTVFALAKHTADGKLPKVTQWPAGSTKARVQRFRDEVNALGDKLEAQGQTARADQLFTSAASERGQGGIAGQLLD